MTRKDYELIAEAIATVEADYHLRLGGSHKGRYAGVLEDVVEGLSDRLEWDNPRFDRSRFKLAAMPLKNGIRDEIPYDRGSSNYEAMQAAKNR